MKKRILAMLLVLAMVVSMVPVAVTAEGTEVTASPHAGTHTDGAHADDCGLTEGWLPWNSTTSLPTSGNYYLTGDVTVTSDTNATGDLNLCLNGYVIRQTGSKRILGTPKENLESTVTICDCTAYTEDDVYYAGAMTGSKMTLQDGGGVFFVRPNTTLKIYDGRFTGNTYQNDTTTTGGAVIMVRAKTSGYIGKLYIYGGEFTDNHSYKQNGTTNNVGGVISLGNDAVFEIKNAVFKNNSGSNGGAIYANRGTGLIENCTFTDNLASSSGSAIHVNSGLDLTIGDGTVITGNTGTHKTTSDPFSAAVVMGSTTCKLTLSGQVVIAGNTTATMGTASIAFTKAETDVLYVDELAAGSRVEFCTPKNPLLSAPELVMVDGTQTNWNNQWVAHMDTSGLLRYIGRQDGVFTFVELHGHTLCNDTGCADHNEQLIFEPWESATTLPTEGNWYLTQDVTVSAETQLSQAVTLNLCLNGKTVTGGEGKGLRAYSTTAGVASTLNICDCTAHVENDVYTAGKFTGFVNTHTNSGGSVIFIRAGSTLNLFDGILTGNVSSTGGTIYTKGAFTMYDGQISDNKALNGTTRKFGGGVFVDNATMTMEGGRILRNEAEQGGGVYLATATLIMKDGHIDNNNANWGGGVAYGNGNSGLDMRGGTITGNVATSNGGAVQAAYSAAVTKFSGNVTVTGNTLTNGTDNNVRLGASGSVTVGTLGAAAQIGITANAGRVFSKTVSGDLSGHFISDDPSQVVFLNDNSQLQLKDKPVVSTHVHTLCNDTGCTDHTEQLSYEAWTDPTSLPTSGNWYLDTDVHLTAETKIESAVVLNLCLNGHTVTGDSGANLRAYGVANLAGASLNISNCSQQGGFTGFYTTSTGTGGGVFCNRPGNTLKLFDITFTNNKSACAGGAIFSAGTVYIYDCDFVGNEAVNGKDGGAIYNNRTSVDGVSYKGKLYIYGATFTGNTARHGAAIYGTAESTAYLEDVVFDGNISNKADGTAEGAAYRAADAITTMKNVQMVNNRANNGSAVCVYGGSITLENVQITGNHATGGFGAFHMNRNNSGANPIEVIFRGQVVISGNTYGTENKPLNLYMREFEAFVDATGLTAGSEIGVSMNTKRIENGLMNITTGQQGTDISGYFRSDDAAWVIDMDQEVYLKTAFSHVHCVCGKADCTDTTHEKVDYNAWTDATSLPAGGNYCLMTDVTITKEASVTGQLNLCLHGHTVTGGEGKGLRFYSTPGTGGEVLNITDCTAKTENGVYTAGGFYHNTNTHTDSGGGAFFIRKGGTLNFYEGIVSGNATATAGAAFYIQGATANFYGGQISDNKATYGGKWYSGGGLYLDNAISVTVENTVITGNESTYGAGIYNTGTSVLTLGNVTITGNIAHSGGGGINSTGANVTLKLTGAPVITGNQLSTGKADNLRLAATGIITPENLSTEAKVGVTADVFRAISGATTDCASSFFSDNTKLTVAYQDGVLYMTATGNHQHCLCTANIAQGCDHSVQTYVEWDDPTSLPTSGNYYLSVDVTLSAQQRVEGNTLNLCLNGHTIRVGDQGGRVFYMTNGACLRISDCQGGGQLTGATKGAILTNSSGTDMCLELYGGTITDNHSDGSGGALVLQGGVTFNMYGGSITGNSTTSYLLTDDSGNVQLDDAGNQRYNSSNGGGVYVANGVFNMYGGEISGNWAEEVAYRKAGATSDSYGGGHGGGLQVTYGATANLYGGKISGNKAYNGGGIFSASTNTVVNLLGVEISENEAGNGGGILNQSNAVLNMSAGKVSGNIATVSGAGVYVSTGTFFYMTGGEIVGNKAINGTTNKNGGGLYVLSSTVELSGGKIHGNTGASGAGIYSSAVLSGETPRNATIYIMDGIQITDNHASSNGGGIMIMGKAEMTVGEGSKIIMTGGEISGNTAENAGGILVQTKAAMELSGGKITNNRANVAGGGLYISTGTKLTMSGGTISGNVSKSDGGGIHLLRSTAVISGGYIGYNTAANGGGIKNNGGHMTIYNLSVVGNKAVGKTTTNATTGKTTTTTGVGGGIWNGRAGYKQNGVQMYQTPSIYISNIYLANNSSTGAAGGMLVQSQNTIFQMTGGIVTGNSAPDSSGGGIYLSSNVLATISNVTFNGNSGKSTGALYINGNSAQISDCKFYGNQSVNNAGAITISGQLAQVTMKNVEIYDNTAGVNVGGLLVQSKGYVDLQDSKIYNNKCNSTGGGMYFSNPGYGDLKNVEIYGNESAKEGGGIYLAPNASATLENVTVRDNKAASGYGGGIYNRGRVVLTDCRVENNAVQEGNGGGIGTHKVASILLGDTVGVYATNTIISGNRSGQQGGGIYAHRGCPVYLTNCEVTNNTSSLEGGAIYADGILGLQDVIATGNTSGGEGYAVYMQPSEFDGHSYTTGMRRMGGTMVIRDNVGGDLFLAKGAILAVTGESLGSDSYVSLAIFDGLLSQYVYGVYGYEGGNLIYTITAGNRSVVDPELPEQAETPEEPTETTAPTQTTEPTEPGKDNSLLYAGVGAFGLVIAAAAVIAVVAAKKKKATKVPESTQE